MTTDLIDWNLERAAEATGSAAFLERLLGKSLQYERGALEDVAKSRYEAGMHIASANAITDKRTQIGLLDETEAAHTARREAQARVAELTEQVQKLGRELHRHKLDAARYRWLRSAEGRGFPGIVVYEPDTGEMHVVTGVDADAAIDAAMRES